MPREKKMDSSKKWLKGVGKDETSQNRGAVHSRNREKFL